MDASNQDRSSISELSSPSFSSSNTHTFKLFLLWKTRCWGLMVPDKKYQGIFGGFQVFFKNGKISTGNDRVIIEVIKGQPTAAFLSHFKSLAHLENLFILMYQTCFTSFIHLFSPYLVLTFTLTFIWFSIWLFFSSVLGR